MPNDRVALAENVLLVEDDATVSDVVMGLLAEAGYRPHAIADHTRITEAVERWQPRCVILDGELTATGESRSWRDAAALRRAHPSLPVVLFTGDPAVVAEARAARSYRSRAAGFAGIVTKPFDIDDLLSTVSGAMQEPKPVDMLSLTVHELRQPLTVIRGQMQFAQRHHGRDPVGERLAMDRAFVQLDRMDVLISELLDATRLDADGFSLSVTLLDLSAVLGDVVDAYPADISSRFAVSRPTGAVPVHGDAGRITQIVLNLLSNALKYGAVERRSEVSLETDGLEAVIRVRDHGVGIPHEEAPFLFDPFFRSTRVLGIRGTGLGLHISKKLAERHGGRLWLESTSRAGSVFAFALPLARADLESSARPS